MFDTAISITLLCLLVVGLFFWSRGLVKARRDDLVAGVSVLLLLGAVQIVLHATSAVFGAIGELLLALGLVTLVVGGFSRADCPAKRRDQVIVSLMCILSGVMMTLMI